LTAVGLFNSLGPRSFALHYRLLPFANQPFSS
jgi:hypothetical protein